MSSHGSLSKIIPQNGKQMDWWYLAPLLLAVVMFLLVGTIFEKKIEQKIKNFVSRHLSREGPEQEMTTMSASNQANFPSSSRPDGAHQCVNPICNKELCKNSPDKKNLNIPSRQDGGAATPLENQTKLGPKETQILVAQPITQNLTEPHHELQKPITADDVRTSLSRSAVRIRSRHLAPEIH